VVRVLILHTTLPTKGRKPGGVEVAVHRLANALVDLGVAVTVGSLSDAPTDARYVHRRFFDRLPWLRDSRFGRLVVLPMLLNGIRLNDANVVHYHGDDWFVMRRPRTTVRTLHGSALREAQRATRWQRRLVQYLVYPLERVAARLATVSVAVGADAARIYGLTRVIGNGVDPQFFHPGAKSTTPTVLYVGTWEGRKRGRWMYELFVNEIAPRHPDAQLHFLSDIEPPAHPRVTFHHFPSDAALAQAYREAWVFALPSTYEGFGIPYLEAMASGTAVVATPNTGARELLADGRYGVIAEDSAFAGAVLELLGDSAHRDHVAAAGLERSKSFTWESVAKSYLALYEEALAMHGDRPGVA
jgi:glycosyltransferase involved in cell wall biosynthesis